ncbi:imidazole glycerol phosphate synthase subunit HisH [Brevundimonas sp. 2R-24]|uniref:Imidazole glycerol phosphate synthase subunit HisH n=1 Tax=Peiella sedimenti TaxID=3061083 RepID=A0ABT8SJ31_9CAUL|nr:imidazole glycerol phosphate synthase subunit HisH [Caulobacteraceae bacterium XZ-24]
MSLVVVDIGVGNTASMVWALERLGARPRLSADAACIADAEQLVFPGVGAAGFAAERIEALGLTEVLHAFNRPLLGVCLGMQMLFERSEEGGAPGLGRLAGTVRRLRPSPERPSPHMGWNRLSKRADDPLLEGVEDGTYAYFVHGYAAPVTADTVASCTYGEPFSAVVRRGNAWGCQFHPERSGPVGARILRNFLDLPC